MKLPILTTAVTAALFSAGMAFAETSGTVLSVVNGSVLVNQGTTYESAQQGMALEAGDQLLLMEGASAQVSFAAGCVKDLGANEILRIPENDSACLDDAATYHQMGGSGGGFLLPALMTGGMIAIGVAVANDDGPEGSTFVPTPDSP